MLGSQDASSPGEGAGRAAAREYSQLWQRQPQSLSDFLQRHAELSVHELAAIVRVDLRERWRCGERPLAEEYLASFPPLAANDEAAVDTIYAEFLAREKVGERPQVSEYAVRFPQYEKVLNDQVQLHAAFDAAPPSDDPGTDKDSRQADYEILGELGRGGMGIVYRARQTGLNRLVALKMVRHADLANDELLERFRSEAEVVASLHHPQIVQVYDYGEHEGCPYLALELVEGGTLADRLDGRPWKPSSAARLLQQLARAVHFAHEHGVVHRDLKPNNLLISADGEPPQVKIADFGLARIFRDRPSGRTQTGALLGTPSYMAPEQAYGRQSDVGPATDIYALGAVLYELLSGRPPYRGETAIETLQQVLLAEPASIHRLAPGLPRDLATICSKCLERTPGKRYKSAAALADDLQRFIADRPIEARPASNWERGWRWCRRNPTLAGALGSVAALLIVVSIVSTWYSGQLRRQLEITKRAESAERKASETAQLRLWDAYLAEIAARNASRQMGQRYAALETVERARRLLATIGSTEQRELQLRKAAITSLALPDLRSVGPVWQGEEPIQSAAVALAADRYALNVGGTLLAIGSVTGGNVLVALEHAMPNAGVDVSADGRLVALTNDWGARVWRIADRALELVWEAPGVQRLSLLPDGQQAVIGRAGKMLLVNAVGGEVVRTLADVEPQSACWFHAPSHRFAVHTKSGGVVVNWESGQTEFNLPATDGGNVQMAWHPRGDVLATWGSSEPITLWNVRSRKPLLTIPQRSFPQQMLFTANGDRLVACGLWDSRLMIWDAGTGQREFEVQGFANIAAGIDTQGSLSLFKHTSGTLQRWELASGAECRFLPTAWFPIRGTRSYSSISPDNRLLVLSGERGLEIWDLARSRRIAARASTLCRAVFDRRGDLIVATEGEIQRWPRRDRDRSGAAFEPHKKVVSFGPPSRLGEIGIPSSLASCQPDETLVFETNDGWWAMSMESGKRVRLNPPNDPRMAALSSDGRLAAIASWEAPDVTVWNTVGGSPLAQLDAGRFGVLEFSPDGRWLASTPRGVQLWNTLDWTQAHEFHAQGTTPNGLGICFSPDSRALAIGQSNGELRFVDPRSGRDWVCLAHPTPGLATFMSFTSDHRYLVALSADEQGAIRVWDLAKLRKALRAMGLDWPAEVLAIAESTRDAATESEVEVVVEWNDAGWSILQKAIKAIQGPAAAER